MDAVTNTGRSYQDWRKVMITAVTPEGYLMVEPKVLKPKYPSTLRAYPVESLPLQAPRFSHNQKHLTTKVFYEQQC